MDTAEVVQAVAGPMGTGGAAYYFSPNTLAKGKELGLKGMQFYMLGRGGLMGDVAAPVVESAFGYFAGSMVDKIWESASQVSTPSAAAAASLECLAELGRENLADVEGLEAYCAAAEKVVATASRAGNPLFAGMAAASLPDDMPARALQLTSVLRELRGGVHLMAVAATGLDPAVAHAIRRPEMVQPFGYETAPDITEADRDLLAKADALTDEMMAGPYASLDDSEAQSLVDGAVAIGQAFG